MHSKILSTLITALACMLIIMSCRRDRNTEINSDKMFASDNALAEFLYSDARDIADEASDLNTGDHLAQYKTRGACATVTHDTTVSPRELIIDFGPVNCLCNDGRNRRGKIIIHYTGRYRDPGHIHTFGFDQYFVNDNQVIGTKTVQNMGLNPASQSYFTVNVNGAVIKAGTSDTITWISNRTRTWTQGENTPIRLDDVYEITGSGSLTNVQGTRTVSITQALVKAVNCKWMQAGELTITPQGKPARIINYGNGTCDNQATLTVNGNTYNITLH